MKSKWVLAWAMAAVLALSFGCLAPEGDNASGAGSAGIQEEVGTYELVVDLDRGSLDIIEPARPATVTTLNGHTLEVRNGPAGCTWDPDTYVAACEILFKNLDSDECMLNVRTRFNGSTNPSAIMDQADYIWTEPGVSYSLAPNTAQPINESGYCITDDSPGSAGSGEGCANTWQESIPPGGVATQKFFFTNVPVGNYTVYLQVFADYQACPAPAGMALIPAGCFDMGDAFSEGGTDELPVHNVCITSSFNMDRHEVTNAEYAACVSGGGCTAPGSANSRTRIPYYGNPTYDNFPVISVSWNQAAAYCAWASKRLPTEAEWEYAARGGLSGKRYPWGDTATACVDANFNFCIGDTSEIGSYPANGYGLYDVGGNVWEWMNDWYSSTYYSSSPTNDPPGPTSGFSRVLRGGYYLNGTNDLRVTRRTSGPSAFQDPSFGFRCAGD